MKGSEKMVNNNDLNELRRMVTNSYDNDKTCIIRILKGINDLINENQKLKSEIQKLRIELNEPKNYEGKQ